MPRTRLLHPDAPLDEDIASLGPCARLVWAYLPCHADRAGRLPDKPFTLKLAILPTDDVDMNQILDELQARRLIARYATPDGKRYLEIRSFARYQRPHTNEAESTIPPPPADAYGTTVAKPTEKPVAPSKDASPPTKVDSAPPYPVSDPIGTKASDRDEEPRAPARDPNLFERILAMFCAKWQVVYGESYIPTPKDKAQLGRLIKQLPADHDTILGGCFDRYLANRDPFIVEKIRHSLAYFCTDGGLNKYRTSAPASRPAQPQGPALCEFHRDYHNNNRPSKYPKPQSCDECKHIAARSMRREGQPTSLGDLLGGS